MLKIIVPDNKEILKRDIYALKNQIENEKDEKSKQIFIETLKEYEKKLEKKR